MKQPAEPGDDRKTLLDEIEQLQTSLETALEENARLIDDRQRLRTQVADLIDQVRWNQAVLARQQESGERQQRDATERQDESDEALRVAIEELRVLTEELEVANSSLQETNQELDARVAERTRQLSESNSGLRSAEASFRTVADLVPDLLWRADPTGDATWFNQRWFDYTGQNSQEPLGLGWLDAVHPLDRAVSRSSWAIAVTSGQTYQREHRVRGDDGIYRWFLIRAEPLRDDSGRIVNWFVAGTDIHEQRMAIQRLEESEQRFRVLIEGMPQLVWRAVDGGKWTWSSPQWSAYTGQAEEASHASGWLDVIHPDDRQAVRLAWDQARHTGTLEFEARLFHVNEARYRRFRSRALPVRGATGNIVEWLGTSTDIDDLLQLQAQQDVLVKELQHRTRNLMAVVHAVTMRTIKQASSLDEFRKCIDDRLEALARVQGLLSRRDGGLRVPFDLLLRDELSAHVTLDAQGSGDKVTTEGPAGVSLRSATVQTLALALHELATNAVKYGAIAAPDGHLHVRWSLAGEEPPVLSIDWRESGVTMPEAGAPPRGGGYGRELIERALPYQLGAKTSFSFEEDGVHCTIEMAIPGDGPTLEKSDG